ncbi:MAG: GNAT family N-acetyltransferase [Bacteroidetes bacterium]|nr:GNAT family N-acetyltransferase [Bacteroidota bacterium]
MYDIIKFSTNNPLFSAPAFEIRRKVFVEEQNVPAEEEFDEFEEDSQHFLALLNDLPLGTARWRFTDYGIKLERFAVIKEYRNKNVGHALLTSVLEEVKPYNKTIYIHAQVPALKFYERFGFIIKGALFIECDIEHYMMVLDI